jgi:nucleoside-diphosphate-sugar epimerase
MRVLVTGHHGYIGVLLVPMLQNAGHEVVGLDTDLFVDSLFKGPLPKVKSIIKDLRDIERADLDGFDAVCHLAALSNDPLGNINPQLTYDINHHGSVNLAKHAKAAGVKRFLFSSSCSTYGAAGQEQLLTEEAEFNPVTPYGHSKVLVERDVRELADKNFSPSYLRNTTAYGVSQLLRFDLVVNNLVAWAITTGKVMIKSDGTPWRPLVHIEDICRAFLSLLEAPRDVVHNQAFNVGITEENYQVRDLAQIVKETVPNCEIEYSADGGPDKRCYRVDFSKIKREIPAFKPQWNVRKGAKELYDTCRQADLTLEDFEGPKFKRIDHIKRLMAAELLDENLRWRTPVPAAKH